MKNFLLILAVVLLSSFSLEGVSPLPINISIALAVLVGCWEVVARLIPTVNQWGPIGKVIEVLTWLSVFLNNKKK